ncbi:MAG: rutE [Gammaproteobacteria bacterium]|nr:rutE [Gammaproteobacteria bacterium]
MTSDVQEVALDQLFRAARSVHSFRGDPVTDDTLKNLYDLMKWGPTAFNAQPARYVFVRSAQGKGRLAPALSAGNRDKSLAAPATVIVAYDSKFFERLPEHSARVFDLFSADGALAEATAFRNGTLQGAYLLIAARALGLSAGPMSGFNPDAINREFFPDGRYRANFLANIGYADDSAPRPRGRRFEFADVAEVI